MDGITIYELNRRMKYANEICEKLDALPKLISETAKDAAALAGKGKGKRPEGDEADEIYGRALDKLNIAINDINRAATVICEYGRLLEGLTQSTRLEWPPTCVVMK